jgi:tartrate dehydrogenase/decarboxylase / D-malate dehydrogenase
MAQPDIAGRGIANPIAAIWAGAMMLDHLGARIAAVTSSSSPSHLTRIEFVRPAK